MKLFTFSLLIIAVVFTLGCSAENPICSTNFCAVGEVFPRAELEDGQAFSEVDIDDSVIFATLVGGVTPVDTTPAEATTQPDAETTDVVLNTTMASIVSDTAADGTRFEGKIIEIAALVKTADPDNTYITLQTNNADVTFFVNAPGDTREGTFDQPFTAGRSYTLKLYIEIQAADNILDGHNIWSYPVENIIKTTVDAIVSDTAAGGTRFEGKVVEVTVVIKNVFTGGINFMTLENDKNASFHVSPYGDFDRKKFFLTFTEGNSYNLHLFIREQDSEIGTRIRSTIVKVD